MPTAYDQSVDGTLTPGHNFVKAAAKGLSGLLSGTGILILTRAKSLAGTLSNTNLTGGLKRALSRSLAGTISTITGRIAKAIPKSFSGTVTMFGSRLLRKGGRILLGAKLILTGSTVRYVRPNLFALIRSIWKETVEIIVKVEKNKDEE
jgi:hypothetical protein